MIELERIDRKGVEQALESASWTVIDTRDSNTFIGWRLNGEKKKGHIPGATDFAAEWIRFPYKSPWEEEGEREHNIEQKLLDKKIPKDSRIILYDTTEKDAPIVAEYLKDRGYKYFYYFNFSEWDGDTVWAEHYEEMVPVQWVKAVMDGKNPEHFHGGRFKIFEVSETDEPCEDFINGHIPGSVHISVNEFQQEPEWCTVSDEKLRQFACDNGITKDTTVILYAMGYTGASHILATVLRYMGVEYVHCINGTSNHWLYMGYEIETGNHPKEPVEDFGAVTPGRKEEIVKIDEVKEFLLEKEEMQLIDMRSWEQYIGATSGYPHVKMAGRIPKTLWCAKEHWYLNPDETMGNPEEMVEHWKSCGVDPGKRMVFFCGSGAW